MKYFIPLESEKYYHIFNRAIGNEKLFKNEENYLYFLKKFKEYINPIAESFSYVLMPNHFHFLIYVKNKNEIYHHYKELPSKKEIPSIIPKNEFEFDRFVMQQFSNFFNSYTKSFNKKFHRKGALFIDYLKRSLIENEEYLKNVILYIHQNPIHHKYINRLEEWKYSSYLALTSSKHTSLKRDEVINIFKNLENFIFEHTILKNIDYVYYKD